MSQVLTQVDALVELELLSVEATEKDRDDFFVKIVNSDLPMEIITRLTALWDVTKEVGGRIVQIGKLVVIEIMKFIAKFPHMSIGMAIGAALHALVAAVPFIGPIIAPLIAVVGASIGFRLDTGKPVSDSLEGTLINTFSDVVEIAKNFLQWFIDVLRIAFSNG